MKHSLRRAFIGVLGGVACATGVLTPARADEGGVSLWLPGQFGSLAAVPTTPGWELGAFYYHGSVSAGGDKSFPISGKVTAGVDGRANFLFLAPTYTFADPVLGGQAGVSLAWAFGRSTATADVTKTGPLGRTIAGSQTDSIFGGSELYPMGTLKWNSGTNNWMADRAFLLVPAQAIVGQWIATFKEFPPRAKAASFSIDQVVESMMPKS